MAAFEHKAGRIACVVNGGSGLMVLSGEFDVFDALNFASVRDELLGSELRNLTVDAGEVSFVDCAFLGTLVALAGDCVARHIRFCIADPSPVVARLSELLGLDDVLRVARHRPAVQTNRR